VRAHRSASLRVLFSPGRLSFRALPLAHAGPHRPNVFSPLVHDVDVYRLLVARERLGRRARVILILPARFIPNFARTYR
jgi:hypothetical protein